MTPRPHTTRRVPKLALAASAAGMAVFGMGFWTTDALLERSYGRAMLTTAVAESQIAVTPKQAPVAGNEAFWLDGKRHEAIAAANWTKPLAVGGHITIASGEPGTVLEILEIRDVSSATTVLGLGDGTSRKLLLTCRDANDKQARPVRLVVDGLDGPPVPAGVTRADHVL